VRNKEINEEKSYLPSIVTNISICKFNPCHHSKINTYLLRVATLLLQLCPPHIFYVRFRDRKFLQGWVVSPTPNPHLGGPGYLSYSGISLETYPAWVAAAGIALDLIGAHKPPHPATECFRQGGDNIEGEAK
jgi:hypothetical protein